MIVAVSCTEESDVPSPSNVNPTPTALPTTVPTPPSQEPGAQANFRGELGDFEVVGSRGSDSNFACASGFKAWSGSEEQLRRSELYFSVPRAEMDAVGECAGQIVSVRQSAGNATLGRTAISRTDKVFVFFDAPRDRLRLATVNGHPALVEEPNSASGSYAQVIVLERRPDEQGLGIIAWAHLMGSGQQAIALVSQFVK